MVDDDSDYELMPKKDIDKLKKELSTLKRNPYGESDKGKDLQQSIERLNNTMNKLISILEDAQQDIIDEYQDSKPIEKLNQILDQNETIAKALVSMHNKIDDSGDNSVGNSGSGFGNNTGGTSTISISPMAQDVGPIVVQTPQIPRPQMDASRQQMPPMPQFNPQPRQMPQQPQQFQQPQFQQPQFQQPQQFNPQQFAPQQFTQQYVQQRPAVQQPPQFQRAQMTPGPDFSPLPPLDSMNDLPPLEGLDSQQMDSGMLPEQKKKKFLGII
jgi:hypothetical protein